MVQTVFHHIFFKCLPISLRWNVNVFEQVANFIVLRRPSLIEILVKITAICVLAIFKVVEGFAAFLSDLIGSFERVIIKQQEVDVSEIKAFR